MGEKEKNCTQTASPMTGLQFVSKKETRMGSKAIESLRWFDGCTLVIGKRCRCVADGTSTLITNCHFFGRVVSH